MASLGKLANSLVSMTNENTLALVNLNLDFALLRSEPPIEFLPVGSALTKKRKAEAESGVLHETACKLGFLFYEMLPDTPRLLEAYGSRITEILSHPGINPEGTENDGPFRAFVGADCTSIWAAATSGPASLGVLLLACMLARAWDAKTATSIWFELIEERKRYIQTQVDRNKIVHPYSVAAVRYSVGRQELAEWDASARSWLRRADVGCSFRSTQLTLITDNIRIPFSSSGTTFAKVTRAWLQSMEVLEKLLNNLPQQALDRAVLLAISSWHIYPDLLVFQQEAQKIPFKDPLFPSGGVLSVGLEYRGSSQNSNTWSLALSHLRYYGDPVPVRSSDRQDRIHIDKLWLVALGVLFRQWCVPYSSFLDAVDWFKELGALLHRSGEANRPGLSWVLRLCKAASEEGGDKLIKHGMRLDTEFFGEIKTNICMPFFGLCNPCVMAAMTRSTEIEVGIEYLRNVALSMGLEAHRTVISYTGMLDHEAKYTEWASIAPIEAHLGTTAIDDTVISEKKHARWLHPLYSGNQNGQRASVQRRLREIEMAGERGYVGKDVPDLSVQFGRPHNVWKNPPPLFRSGTAATSLLLHPVSGQGNHDGRKFFLWRMQEENNPWNPFAQGSISNKAVGPVRAGSAWLREEAQPAGVAQYLLGPNKLPDDGFSGPRKLQRKRKASMDDETSMQAGQAKEGGRVQKDDGSFSCFDMMSAGFHQSVKSLLPLSILEVASCIYESFPNATVSLGVLGLNLQRAKWPQQFLRNDDEDVCMSFQESRKRPAEQHVRSMTRADVFSCIAMFESGRFDIDPDELDQVVALCSEDSIYVAGILLCDPTTEVRGADIRHIVGNVGHAGMVMMVSPEQPRVRPVGCDPQMVEHKPFDGSAGTDSFGGTSLHLSFTAWKLPLDWQGTGEIDQEVFLIESVISVQDNGTWVADIDVLGVEEDRPCIIDADTCCHRNAAPPAAIEGATEADRDMVSIDTWEELLDPPPCFGVFRASKNWAARLAAASILAQQKKAAKASIIAGEKICWFCLQAKSQEPHIIIY